MAAQDRPTHIQLTDERRAALLEAFEALFVSVFDDDISDYRKGIVLDFFVRELGPAVYNQAIQDARKFMLEKLDDLDADLYEPER